MTQKSTVPFYIKILGWFISLFAFALGFWHTHHGLKSFKPLGTEYGSYIVAGLISMVLIVAYSRAISGVKIALFFYLVCALFNFTFNLNSFYPTLLGRKLLKEETLVLNDTLQRYSAKIDSIYNDYGKGQDMSVITRLKELKTNIISEIVDQDGAGSNFNGYLNRFNSLTGAKIDPLNSLGDYEQRHKWVETFSPQMDVAIKSYILQNFSQDDLNKQTVIENKFALDSLKSIYTPAFENILRDNSELKIVDSLIAKNPQIDTLKTFTTSLDNICNAVNKAIKKNIISPLNDDKSQQNAVPKIQYIGRFEYTVDSVFRRLNRIDTWGVLLLVLFIDFIVPLAIYFLIKGKTDSNHSSKIGEKLAGKKSPTKF